MRGIAQVSRGEGQADREGFAYALITPARNEAEFIELTIKSMIGQTILPVKWVIVSDGSTDGTDDIVKQYLPGNEWIELVQIPEREVRSFAGKVRAFEAGYERIRGMGFNIIGNLDADISFGPDHFEYLLGKFSESPSLGVAGTAFVENDTLAYDYDIVNIEHVSGACQIFRRECFEQIGGYVPIKGGGVDWTAVTTARMRGWQTRTFPERNFVHHRKMGTGVSSYLGARFRFGKQDYYLGGHPLWEIFRSLYQMKKRPYLLGGLFLFSGYMWGCLSFARRPISAELVEFRRKEQMYRLKNLIRKKLNKPVVD